MYISFKTAAEASRRPPSDTSCQVEGDKLGHVAHCRIQPPRAEHRHFQRRDFLLLDVTPRAARAPERFGLVECARRHPERFEQFLTHKPGERLTSADLKRVGDKIIAEVGVAEAFPHPALEPGVGDAPDVLIEGTPPVAVIIADRSLVAEAPPVAEQMTKSHPLNLRPAPRGVNAKSP